MIELDGSVDCLDALAAAVAPGLTLGPRPLDDLSGAIGGSGVLVWRDHRLSAAALGPDATVAWLQRRIEDEATPDRVVLQAMLDAVEEEGGPTLFDYVVEMFESAGWQVELR